MSTQSHWESVYGSRRPDEVSWFEDAPATSLQLIRDSDLDRGAAIVDVGGGASRLASVLCEDGYLDVTVLDLSAAALAVARAEAASAGDQIRYLVGDVRTLTFERPFALWHDRAAFHFMNTDTDRAAYLRTLRASLAPGGHLIMATFGPDGPATCSQLPVCRYDARSLSVTLGDAFALQGSRLIDHRTPAGSRQQFLWTRFIHP